MSNKTIFLTDFDGTLTDQDFFHQVIDARYSDRAEELYALWDAKTMTDFDYLQQLFAGVDLDEQQLDELISKVPFDPNAAEVLTELQDKGVEVAVISAGCTYYIHKLLAIHGVHNVDVYSNPGEFGDRGIKMRRFEDERFGSELYGINKAELAKHLAKEYDEMIFAGDTKPDLTAALVADVSYAKGALQQLLDDEQHPYVPIDGYADIKADLHTRGIL